MTFDKVTPHEPLLGNIALDESWPETDYNVLRALYDKAKAVFDKSTLGAPLLPEDYDFTSK